MHHSVSLAAGLLQPSHKYRGYSILSSHVQAGNSLTVEDALFGNMLQVLLKWVKSVYRRVITSIAFLPAIIAICFLALSFLMVQFDFSSTGKNIKSRLHWLSLKDASTARSICAAVASGIISLAVFSFSMVMILLSQAASQMSNRILAKLISNTFQQVVLGFYIGTIVYALFLLSTIRDINSGIYVPAISTYLLIALTVLDIFLFIYFLHYITHSVKFETIINKISADTHTALQRSCKLAEAASVIDAPGHGKPVSASKSGLYQGFQLNGLVDFCRENDVVVSFLHPITTYVIRDTALLTLHSKKELQKDVLKQLDVLIDIGRGQDIRTSYYYGFRQLMEIAVKALSPGINDPGTATISLQVLADLLAYRLQHFPETYFKDEEGVVRVITKEKTFKEMFEEYIMPIWDYGKKDRLLQKEMLHVLKLISINAAQPDVGKMIMKLESAVADYDN
jgi:uncharacterized membrane protein